jgi:hypothetical protein
MALTSRKQLQFFVIRSCWFCLIGHSQGEDRWIALGVSVRQLLLVVVHTEDERTIRIISARKADPKEGDSMNSNPKLVKTDDEMRDEYDFTDAVRGKYIDRFPKDVVMVALPPRCGRRFPRRGIRERGVARTH